MTYTKEKIIEMTGTDIAEHGNWVKDLDFKDDFVGADTFWLSKSVTRIGKTSDTNEDYTEVVSEFLVENGFIEHDNFTGIRKITRKESYSTNKKYSTDNSDLVKIFEKFSLVKDFGLIIEESIPLGNYDEDKAGVIDVLSYKKDSDELYIVQVKPHCSDETLLGAVLEIQTYYQTIDKEKLIKDLYSARKIQSNNPQIKKVIVLLSGSNSYNEYNENRPNISQIIKDLQIEIVSIKWNDWEE